MTASNHCWLALVFKALTKKRCRPLPPRRESSVSTVRWKKRDEPGEPVHTYQIGVGFHENGEVGEVFFSDLDDGSMMQMLLDDFSVFVSRLHQRHGISFNEMVTLMSADVDPISPLGLPLREAVARQRAKQEGTAA